MDLAQPCFELHPRRSAEGLGPECRRQRLGDGLFVEALRRGDRPGDASWVILWAVVVAEMGHRADRLGVGLCIDPDREGQRRALVLLVGRGPPPDREQEELAFRVGGGEGQGATGLVGPSQPRCVHGAQPRGKSTPHDGISGVYP